MSPEVVTFLVCVATLGVYLWIGARRGRRITDLDSFLFYSRTLESRGYTRTFVATGISLATVLAFFVDFGGQFGLAIILSPLAYLVGVWLLLRALPAMAADGYVQRGTTLHSFLGRCFHSETVRLVTAAVSLLGYVGILIIEIHVGVQIFRLFWTDTWALAATACALAVLIGTYTWLGGYEAVVATDRLQLWLIGLGTLTGFSAVLYLANSTSSYPDAELFVPAPWRLPTALFVAMVVGNVPLQILRMSNWHRIACVGDLNKVRTGLRHAILWTFLFWLFFNVIGVFLGPLPLATSETFGLQRLLAATQESGIVGAYVGLPILFCGLVAALISTADSILVPVLTTILYDFKHHRSLHEDGFYRETTPELRQRLLRSGRMAIPAVVLGALVLYLILVGVAKFDFVSLLFVFFNQQLVLCPAVLIALDPVKQGIGGTRKLVASAVIVGWLGVWVATLWGTLSETQALVFYAAPIGFVLSMCVPLVSRRAREGMWRAVQRLVRKTSVPAGSGISLDQATSGSTVD